MAVSIISSNANRPVVTKFYTDPSGVEETKICSNRPGHMTNMAPHSYMVKTFEHFLHQNQLIDGVQTYYVARYSSTANIVPMMTLSRP